MLVAFTDGLIERRGEDITDGQDRLSAVAGPSSGGRWPTWSPRWSTGWRPTRDDDMAVLGVRRLR